MRLLLTILLPITCLAQEPTTFSTDVKVVNVLATVRNGKGQIVNSLNKESFSIDEDGHPQTIRYFARENDVPLTLGLLVDTSMSQQRVLGDEQLASVVFLQKVLREDKDHAFLIHFDRDVELSQDLTSSRQKLERALTKLQLPQQLRRGPGDRRTPQAGTTLYDSVLLAANEIMSKESGRKAVIILSDGVDNGSKVSLTEAVEAAQRADLLVYGILFSDEMAYGGGIPKGMVGGGRVMRTPIPGDTTDGKKVLQYLAKETGGSFFEVSRKLPLVETFARIQDELRGQYSLGYNSDQPAASKAYRAVHVAVKEKGLTAQARPGYFPK